MEGAIAPMTAEEKVGQLFFQLTANQEDYLRELVEKFDTVLQEDPNW